MDGHWRHHGLRSCPTAVLSLPCNTTGLLFFRHSKNTTHFIDAWQAKLDADEKVGGGRQ